MAVQLEGLGKLAVPNYTRSTTLNHKLKGLKERPLKGPLGLCRGLMRLYKGYIRVILGY